MIDFMEGDDYSDAATVVHLGECFKGRTTGRTQRNAKATQRNAKTVEMTIGLGWDGQAGETTKDAE